MKITVLFTVVLLAFIQIILAILKVLSVITLRWLWVLTPLWLLVCLGALCGVYMVVKSKHLRG